MSTLVLFRETMKATESLITLSAGEITEGELLTATGATIGGCHFSAVTCVRYPCHFCAGYARAE
jgi:hypothetical protein